MMTTHMFKTPGMIELNDIAVDNDGRHVWRCVDEPVYVPGYNPYSREIKITAYIYETDEFKPLWYGLYDSIRVAETNGHTDNNPST
jgi:hypothetical protein